MRNKNNVPYYIAGTLATFTLLASGVFAAAPYIGFLAPVAALSVGLPFIIGYAVFSVVTIALSYKAISKNKTISEKVKEIEGKDKTIFEKEAQLDKKSTGISNLRNQLDEEEVKVQTQKRKNSEKEKEIKDKDIQLADEKSKADKIISEKDLEIFRMKNELAAIKRINASQPGNVVEFDSINQQLTKRDFEVQTQEQAIISQAKGKFNSVGNKLKNIYDTMPSAEFAKDIKTASEKAFTSTKEAFISGRVTRIVKDGLKDVYGTSFEPVKSALNSFGSSLKNTCDTSIESAKGTISSAGNKLKNVYGTSVEYTKGALNSVGSGLKNTCDTSIESAKGTISSVGNKLKNVYDTMPSTKIEFS
ncbi:coiled-coil domain-containing protein [Wolbachia pipientis]|uniref:hypothetical protein n=1 Tax=Wolbachia pipientis TaxID=955 RepID=UPI002174E214|nr:hypothetical protein [Wolbachia pipientis]